MVKMIRMLLWTFKRTWNRRMSLKDQMQKDPKLQLLPKRMQDRNKIEIQSLVWIRLWVKGKRKVVRWYFTQTLWWTFLTIRRCNRGSWSPPHQNNSIHLMIQWHRTRWASLLLQSATMTTIYLRRKVRNLRLDLRERVNNSNSRSANLESRTILT